MSSITDVQEAEDPRRESDNPTLTFVLDYWRKGRGAEADSLPAIREIAAAHPELHTKIVQMILDELPPSTILFSLRRLIEASPPRS